MAGTALMALGAAVLATLILAGAWPLAAARRRRTLGRRLQQIGAPLRQEDPEEAAETGQGIFRSEQRKGWLAARVEARYPLLVAGKALMTACGCGAGGALGMWLALTVVLQVEGGWLPMVLAAAAMAASMQAALIVLQARQGKRFTEQFPEVVDQIVQLSRTGMPPLEALSTVVDDLPTPTRGVLEAVRDRLSAGLDADRSMRAVARRVRIPEFTLFCAVLRLQRRAGGGVSEALGNLSRTLRERRKIALKAHGATAQTRLTLLVLVLLPVVVLAMQRITAPASLEILFNTPDGVMILRIAVGLIATGIMVAWALITRGAR